jgi:hypothetical protein
MRRIVEIEKKRKENICNTFSYTSETRTNTVLIYILFFIQISYFSFVNLIDFVVVVVLFIYLFCIPIFLPRLGINILIFFMGLMF